MEVQSALVKQLKPKVIYGLIFKHFLYAFTKQGIFLDATVMDNLKKRPKYEIFIQSLSFSSP